jgi:hypothetical protein
MTDICEVSDLLAIRPRVAIVLSIASRTLPALEGEESNALARAALDNGWKWEIGERVTARDLYSHIGPLGMAAGRARGDQQRALCAIGTALYYVTWQAFRQELRQKKKLSVPNDMADVDDEAIVETAKQARQVGAYDLKWENALVERALRDYSPDDPEALGPAIPRDGFAF